MFKELGESKKKITLSAGDEVLGATWCMYFASAFGCHLGRQTILPSLSSLVIRGCNYPNFTCGANKISFFRKTGAKSVGIRKVCASFIYLNYICACIPRGCLNLLVRRRGRSIRGTAARRACRRLSATRCLGIHLAPRARRSPSHQCPRTPPAPAPRTWPR